jgi:SWI/SNF-related matrix-associated actin-dependent regulator of chromatin subfamily D
MTGNYYQQQKLKHQQQQHAAQQQASQQPPKNGVMTVEKTPEAILEYILPKDSPFFALKALETQIDEKILERQQRLVDIQFKKERSPRRLLIRIGNSCADQQHFNKNDEDLFRNPPSWSLRIEGKLEPTVGRPSRYTPPPFLHWVRGFKAEFTDDLGNLVFMEEWKKENNAKLSDSILIKRKGSTPLNVKVLLDIDYHVEKYRVSKPLYEILQTEIASKALVIVLLWQYIKLNKLQVSEKAIMADEALQRVFGVQKLLLSDIPALISQHLFPPEPLILQYRLQLDNSSFIYSPEIYDLVVDYDDTSLRSSPKLNHPALLTLIGEISLLDKKLAENIELLKAALANERILRDFATDPAAASQRIVANHCRDIRTVTGEVATFSLEDLYRDDLFQGQNIEHALFEYANLQPQDISPQQ